MPTETNVHGDALCFVVKTWTRHKTTERVLNTVGGWRLSDSAVGGWRLVVVGGWRRLAAVGGPRGLSLTKKNAVLKESPAASSSNRNQR